MQRLLHQIQWPALAIEIHHTVTLRVLHPIAENGGAIGMPGCSAQNLRQPVAVENIIAEGERYIGVSDEFPANQKCLRDSARIRLRGVLEAHSPLLPGAQQALKGLL